MNNFWDKSIVRRLFLLLLAWYVIVVIVVTVVGSGFQIIQTRQAIITSVQDLGISFTPGLSNAVWTFDSDFINSNLKGIVLNPNISAARIEDKNGKVTHSLQVEKKSGIERLLPHLDDIGFDLWTKSRKDNRIELGRLYITPSKQAQIEKLRQGLLIIFVYTIITLLILGGGFLFLGRRLLTRPLTQLARAIESIDPGRDRVVTGLNPDNMKGEIKTLLDMVNILLLRSAKSREALDVLNKDLENQVNFRTAELSESNRALKKEITNHKLAQKEIETLRGIIPICSHCKNIRDDTNSWHQLETYISNHSEAQFSHGICPKCAEKHYPGMDIYDENET